MAHIGGLREVDAAAVEFGVRKALAKMLNQDFLQRGVPEIPEAEGSKQPDLVPMSTLPQQNFLSIGTGVDRFTLHGHRMDRKRIPNTPEFQHFFRRSQRNANIIGHLLDQRAEKNLVFLKVFNDL
jgi:hypothetical protein